MNRDDAFDRTISDWLHADAEHRVPEHLDAVLRRTSMERQRPAWSSLERWLPMDTTIRARAFVPRPGRVALVIALLIALAGLVIFAVGSRSTRLPPPFGLARNGVLLSSRDGDIVAVDPVTADQKAVISGPSFDFGPTFSRDGTKFAFLRGAPADCGKPDCGLLLMVANADGSAVRALTAGLAGLDWLDWSPDGSQIVIDSAAPAGNGHVIDVVDVDGSGMRTLDVGRPAHELYWLPPEGKEIVFRGERSRTDPLPGIFAVHPDGTKPREVSITPATSSNDYQDVNVSSNGALVTYRDDGNPGGFRIHILDLASGLDRILPGPKGQRGAVFSPDSKSVVFLRAFESGQFQLVVAPVDGKSEGKVLGPPAPLGPDGPTINNYTWTPDGSAILANYDDDKTARLLPIDGSPTTDLVRGELALPAYQRLAP